MGKKQTAASVVKETNGLYPWLARPRPNPEAALRLFCFPYAGGGAATFHNWPRELPLSVELCSVHLPGRGARLMEAPFTEMRVLVESLAGGLLPHMDKPFAFFGHSLGAMIGFELARYLRRHHKTEPSCLFVSAAPAPQLREREKPIHNLPEPEFIRELGKLNGTPHEVLENEELMQLMLPTLRADFALSEKYSYRNEPPLDCPIAAYGGGRDHNVSREHLEAWREQSASTFSLNIIPGDHFFLHGSQTQLLDLLSRKLNRLVSSLGTA
jgi:medium-chain acyl-[acyl-carrier-protein] hydrolase